MKWFCCQLGAREHYAIPRALFQANALASLVTDAWISPSCLLAKISGQGSRLRDRFHNQLSGAPVTAFNSSLILFELLARARRLQKWEAVMARNHWFQNKVLSVLRSRRSTIAPETILLSYSYTALRPIRYAKSQGWKTVLVQIDPGPEEERIVKDEVARVPEFAGSWQPAPVEYWASWREECDLADAIVVNSEWSREGLLRSGIPSEKLTAIPLAYERTDVASQWSEIRRTKTAPPQFTHQRPMRVPLSGSSEFAQGRSEIA